jgi:hypothetical protein
MDPARARSMWRLIEPIHTLTYFAPESVSALQATGLRGYWMAYFAGRASPMGEVDAPIVEATFFNFSSRLVRRAIPDAWAFTAPDEVLHARWVGVSAALGPHLAVLTDAKRDRVRTLLEGAAASLVCDGRVLAAANQTTVPDEPVAALWQAITTLREHRGDGHVAALVAAGLSGLEAHLTLVAAGGMPRSTIQGARGFTDDEWETGIASLAQRGLLDHAGEETVEGRRVRAEVEAVTDRVALAPWAALGDDRCDDIAEALLPVVRSITAAGLFPTPNPIGLHEN